MPSGEVTLPLFLFLCACVRLGLAQSSISTTNFIGTGIDVLNSFGDLSLVLRVAPRNDTEPWLFRDNKPSVFKSTQESKSWRLEQKSHGKYTLRMCDNVDKLMEAYFDGIRVDGVKDSWRAIAKSWSPRMAGRKFGISEGRMAPNGPFGYFLFRVNGPGKRVSLKKTGEISDGVKPFVDGVTPGAALTVRPFLAKAGTHFVSSYVTGDSVFQVMVYPEVAYFQIKKLLEEGGGLNAMTPEEVNSIFSPLFAVEIGQIMVTSGNATVTRWARDTFIARRGLLSFPSLLLLQRTPHILPRLKEMMSNSEAILKLKLNLLDVAFSDESKRTWFKEIVANKLQLYETNS